jgi:hypothetical protein
MFALRTANLIIAFIATTAPTAHALEMISKLTLDGPLWLGIQQHLYRGWGEIFGTVEIAALLSTLALLILTRRDRSIRGAYLIALACYAAMLADFFIFNLPVNEALRAWTPRTFARRLERLPPSLGNWPRVHRPLLGDRIRHADPPTYPQRIRVVTVINFAGEAMQ